MCLSSFPHAPAGAASLREVIEVQSQRGSGAPGDELHAVTQYWSKEGVLLAEYDTKWEDPARPACDLRSIESARERGRAGPAAAAERSGARS